MLGFCAVFLHLQKSYAEELVRVALESCDEPCQFFFPSDFIIDG
jgi:hypothetical protein